MCLCNKNNKILICPQCSPPPVPPPVMPRPYILGLLKKEYIFFDFSQALQLMKKGYRLTRRCWELEGKDISIFYTSLTIEIDFNSSNNRSTWIVDQDSVLAEDWIVVERY